MNERTIEKILAEPKTTETVHGRVSSIRTHKRTTFLDLIDPSGKIQLVIKNEDLPKDVRVGAFIRGQGKTKRDPKGNTEVQVQELEMLGNAHLKIPSPWELNALDPTHSNQVMGFPEVYAANPNRMAVLGIKTQLIGSLHQFFQNNGFTQVEPPIITNKTLYGRDNAIQARVHGEDVFLSQCATFELEPLALAFGKVYTISPAFRNEKSGSRRHLAEYTHAKAEVLLANCEDLMELSRDALEVSLRNVTEHSSKELSTLNANVNPVQLERGKQEFLTYTQALKILEKKGSRTVFGEGLKRSDEQILTKHAGDKYVWVGFPPFCTEGFPYKRHPSNKDLSMTCDLIAPHGAGEMVGVAEKTSDAEELVENIIAKGLKKDIGKYWHYIALRRYGLPPHGGIGAAPERIIYGVLNLPHIRLTKPWPRDPDRKINRADEESLPTYGDPTLNEIKKKYVLD